MFPWSSYSRKVHEKIASPQNIGSFGEESEGRGFRLVIGEEGEVKDGNRLKLYLLVDEEDGVIADARFQAFGHSALIASADAACDLLVRKNYDQAKRIGVDLIDKELRDRSNIPAFPDETAPHLNLVISAIDAAVEKCEGIPLASSYVAPPTPMDAMARIEGEGYPGWDDLNIQNKLIVIENVLDEDIRPYIALDGGGVEVKDLSSDRKLTVVYQGNCTSCFSATGATLSYIQQVLQAKVHPELVVVPEF